MEKDMRKLLAGSDASSAYRETSAVATARLDNTADIGSLATILRNSVLTVVPPISQIGYGASVPLSPEGDLRTVVR